MFWCIVPVGRGSVECRRSISSGESLSHAVNPCQSSGVRKSTPGLLSVDGAGLSGKLPGAPATAWGPVSVETPPIQCRLGAESFAAMPLAAATFTPDTAVGAFRAVATPAPPALLAPRVFSSKSKLRAPLSSLPKHSRQVDRPDRVRWRALRMLSPCNCSKQLVHGATHQQQRL